MGREPFGEGFQKSPRAGGVEARRFLGSRRALQGGSQRNDFYPGSMSSRRPSWAIDPIAVAEIPRISSGTVTLKSIGGPKHVFGLPSGGLPPWRTAPSRCESVARGRDRAV